MTNEQKKIEILTGSHYSNEEYNKKQFKKINELLLNEKNPLYKKFNQEEFYLDDCDGLISIVKSSHYFKELTQKQFFKLKTYLLKHIKLSNGFLYVGCLVHGFN